MYLKSIFRWRQAWRAAAVTRRRPFWYGSEQARLAFGMNKETSWMERGRQRWARMYRIVCMRTNGPYLRESERSLTRHGRPMPDCHILLAKAAASVCPRRLCMASCGRHELANHPDIDGIGAGARRAGSLPGVSASRLGNALEDGDDPGASCRLASDQGTV